MPRSLTARRVAVTVVVAAAGCGALSVVPRLVSWWIDVQDAAWRLRAAGGDPHVMAARIATEWEHQLHACWVEGVDHRGLPGAIDAVTAQVAATVDVIAGTGR